MTVVVNGQPLEIERGVSVVEVLQCINVSVDSAGVAVARNGEVVPRSAWPEVVIASGDHIEVLHAVQGG